MLRPPDPEQARILRKTLDEAKFSDPARRKALGLDRPALPWGRHLPRIRTALAEPLSLQLLGRWFVVGDPVSEREAREVLPEEFLDAALHCGLLFAESGLLHPSVALKPLSDRILASDLPAHIAGPDQAGHVLVAGPPAEYLLRFTLRHPIRSILDLGSGTGVQAFAAAAHADQVTATDLNPRAGEFIRLNAALNGVGNVEVLIGDRFEPVRGRTFDLIVSNPPFILGPAPGLIYGFNEEELDGFCRDLLGEAPAYLEEGGFLQMIWEWAEVDGEPWEDRLRGWLTGSGCDALVLHDYRQDPIDYTHTKLQEFPAVGNESDERFFQTWIDSFRERGVVALHGGLIALRKRSGKNWISFHEVPGNFRRSLEPAVRRAIKARDLLETASEDEVFLAERLRLVPGTQLAQVHRPEDGAWISESVRLSLDDGLTAEIGLTPDVASFVARFDGTRDIQALAEELRKGSDIPKDRVQGECLALARRLLKLGFLEMLPALSARTDRS